MNHNDLGNLYHSLNVFARNKNIKRLDIYIAKNNCNSDCDDGFVMYLDGFFICSDNPDKFIKNNSSGNYTLYIQLFQKDNELKEQHFVKIRAIENYLNSIGVMTNIV